MWTSLRYDITVMVSQSLSLSHITRGSLARFYYLFPPPPHDTSVNWWGKLLFYFSIENLLYIRSNSNILFYFSSCLPGFSNIRNSTEDMAYCVKLYCISKKNQNQPTDPPNFLAKRAIQPFFLALFNKIFQTTHHLTLQNQRKK